MNELRSEYTAERLLEDRLLAGFAEHAGSLVSEAQTAIPDAIRGLDSVRIDKLFRSVEECLSRQSGSAALQLLITGSLVLRDLADVYDQWLELLRRVASNKLIGNAELIAFMRATPPFIDAICRKAKRQARKGVTPGETARRVLSVTAKIAELDVEAALLALRSSGKALATVSIDQLEKWALEGLSLSTTESGRASDTKARRSYFALETRQSNETLRSAASVTHAGLVLDEVAQTLRFYIEGLTGREIEIASLEEGVYANNQSRINDGKHINLPALVDEFAERQHNFRLYKVLAAYAAGQIEFGTHLTGADPDGTRTAYLTIAEMYASQKTKGNAGWKPAIVGASCS
ncbi:MAG: hypothetical protein ACRD4L_03910, partial [Pyrinomonadaceae bacterium]